jgi:hypothetical protein
MNKRTSGSPGSAARIVPGDTITARELTTIQSERILLPAPSVLTHLQFRRYAGCPVCNLHLHSIARRHDEITAAGTPATTGPSTSYCSWHAPRRQAATSHRATPEPCPAPQLRIRLTARPVRCRPPLPGSGTGRMFRGVGLRRRSAMLPGGQ